MLVSPERIAYGKFLSKTVRRPTGDYRLLEVSPGVAKLAYSDIQDLVGAALAPFSLRSLGSTDYAASFLPEPVGRWAGPIVAFVRQSAEHEVLKDGRPRGSRYLEAELTLFPPETDQTALFSSFVLGDLVPLFPTPPEERDDPVVSPSRPVNLTRSASDVLVVAERGFDALQNSGLAKISISLLASDGYLFLESGACREACLDVAACLSAVLAPLPGPPLSVVTHADPSRAERRSGISFLSQPQKADLPVLLLWEAYPQGMSSESPLSSEFLSVAAARGFRNAVEFASGLDCFADVQGIPNSIRLALALNPATGARAEALPYVLELLQLALTASEESTLPARLGRLLSRLEDFPPPLQDAMGSQTDQRLRRIAKIAVAATTNATSLVASPIRALAAAASDPAATPEAIITSPQFSLVRPSFAALLLKTQLLVSTPPEISPEALEVAISVLPSSSFQSPSSLQDYLFRCLTLHRRNLGALAFGAYIQLMLLREELDNLPTSILMAKSQSDHHNLALDLLSNHLAENKELRPTVLLRFVEAGSEGFTTVLDVLDRTPRGPLRDELLDSAGKCLLSQSTPDADASAGAGRWIALEGALDVLSGWERVKVRQLARLLAREHDRRSTSRLFKEKTPPHAALLELRADLLAEFSMAFFEDRPSSVENGPKTGHHREPAGELFGAMIAELRDWLVDEDPELSSAELEVVSSCFVVNLGPTERLELREWCRQRRHQFLVPWKERLVRRLSAAICKAVSKEGQPDRGGR